MGTRYEFKCPSCKYKERVAGGEDCGLAAAMTTIVCHDCRALYDVVVSEAPGDAPAPRLTPECPRSRRHHVSPWTAPGACPRCGQIMVEGGYVVPWN